MNILSKNTDDISLKISELILKLKQWAVFPDDFNIKNSLISYGISSIEYIQLLVDIESAFSIELDDQFLIYSDKITCEALAQFIAKYIL